MTYKYHEIKGPRGSGRTSALVEWCNTDPSARYMIVDSTREQQWVLDHFVCFFEVHPSSVIFSPAKCLLLSDKEAGIDNYDLMRLLTQTALLTFLNVGALVSESNIRQNLTVISPEEIVAGLERMSEELKWL